MPSQSGPLLWLRTYHCRRTTHASAEADQGSGCRSLFDITAGDYGQMGASWRWGADPVLSGAHCGGRGYRPECPSWTSGVSTGLVAREAKYLVGDGKLVLGVDQFGDDPECDRSDRGAPGLRQQVDPADEVDGLLSMVRPAPHKRSGRGFSGIPPCAEARVGGCASSEITSRAQLRLVLKGYMRGVVPVLPPASWLGTGAFQRCDTTGTPSKLPFPKSILDALAAAGFVDVIRYVEHGVFRSIEPASHQ